MMFRPEFENETAIDDEMVVLDLLVHRWNDYTVRTLDRRFADATFVEIRHCRDRTYDTIYRFKVTDRVADQLLASLALAGTPEWGYTDMKRLRATESGELRLWDARKTSGLEDRLSSEWWFVRGNVDARATAARKATVNA